MAYNISTINDWKDTFFTQSVQNNQNTFGADFLSSESIVMFAGPAAYETTEGTNYVPIGLVQNVQISQQKQIQQLFEVGSRKPFFVPGRTIISGGIARVLFDGPSLMYAMYISRKNNGIHMNPDTTVANKTVDAWVQNQAGNNDLPADMQGMTATSGKYSLGGTLDAANQPGYFFINLASSFFNKPTGLGFILYDMESQPYGGFYMENCYIQAHTFSVASQQTVLVENVSFRASSLCPLDMTSFGVTSDSKTKIVD